MITLEINFTLFLMMFSTFLIFINYRAKQHFLINRYQWRNLKIPNSLFEEECYLEAQELVKYIDFWQPIFCTIGFIVSGFTLVLSLLSFIGLFFNLHLHFLRIPYLGLAGVFLMIGSYIWNNPRGAMGAFFGENVTFNQRYRWLIDYFHPQKGEYFTSSVNNTWEPHKTWAYDIAIKSRIIFFILFYSGFFIFSFSFFFDTWFHQTMIEDTRDVIAMFAVSFLLMIIACLEESDNGR